MSHVQRLIRGFEFRRRPSADAVLLARKRRKKRLKDLPPSTAASSAAAKVKYVTNALNAGNGSTVGVDAGVNARSSTSQNGATSAAFPSSSSSSIAADAGLTPVAAHLQTSSKENDVHDGELEETMEEVDEGFEENLVVVVIQRRSHERVGMGLNVRGPSNDQRPISGVFVEVSGNSFFCLHI